MSFSFLVKKLKSAKVNEAIIINEILKNSKQIIDKKIYLKDIANMVHISHSTVSRLITKHGYQTWNDFVNSCIIEEIFFNKTSDSMVDKMFLQSTYLKTWMKKNEIITNKIVKEMKNSKLLIFFGERISGNIAQYLSFMMNLKDIMTVHYFFENQIIPLLGNNTILFIFTSSSRTDYSDLIKMADKKGAKIIVIDSSYDDKKYENAIHVKIPMISYVSESDVLTYLSVESIREYMIYIYEKI